MEGATRGAVGRHVYSVSELNFKIKALLENSFPFIWISGEISNLRFPLSGHAYFTLKDAHSQIQGIVFRNQLKGMKFSLEEGQQITGFGRIGLYEIRGSYQIILEHLEPSGAGALQAAFEQLKARLAAEGLFDADRKKTLPFLPRKIGVVTSPSGAVIRDILQVIERRFPNLAVQLVPVKVQGDSAATEIVHAIEILNRRMEVDVVVLARGGGSIEDLQPFNDERVARAIHASLLPLVSAVGHETDFTIADFVADLRAPTPSAAAEMILPVRDELQARCRRQRDALTAAAVRLISRSQAAMEAVRRRLIHPKRRIQDLAVRVDDLETRLRRCITREVARKRERLGWFDRALFSASPLQRIYKYKVILEENANKIKHNLVFSINDSKGTLKAAMAHLHALSPLAVLERGYCIARTRPGADIVRDPRVVRAGQDLELYFKLGILNVRVTDLPPADD